MDVGSVFVRLGFREDDSGFRNWERNVVRAKAVQDIKADLGAKVDDRAFTHYFARLDEAKAKAARRELFKAKLGADYDARAFNAFERDLARAQRSGNILTRIFGNMGSAAATAGDAVGGGAGLAGRVGILSGALGPLAGTLAVAAPLLLAVAGAATALASSLAAAVAGAAGVGVGIGAALGPLAALAGAVTQRVGLMSDAFKALGDEQEKGGVQAKASAEAQRAAAERVKGAEESLQDAKRATTKAQDDLTDAQFRARREVEDLTDAVDRSRLSEERAGLSLKEVLKRLAEVQADPTSTRLEIQQAQLAVKEAQQGIHDAREERKRATEDAKRGTDTVKTAHEALQQARRGEARAVEAVASAQKAQAAASEKQGAAATAAQEKMAQLSETERHLVRTFKRVADAFTTTFRPATDAIFKAADGALQRLTPVMTRYRGQFHSIGEAVGEVVTQASRSLTGPEWTKALDSFVHTAQTIVKPIGNALGSVIDIFRNIAVAAQPYVIELAHWMERALGGLADKTKDGEGLNRTIRSLVDSAKDWAKFMGAVGHLLFTIFNGGKKDGDSLVETMTKMVQRWDRFLGTEKGQKEMRRFFRDSIQAVKDLAKVLGELIGFFFRLSNWILRVNSAWQDFASSIQHLSLNIAVWLRGAFVDAFDFILGGFTTILGGISSIGSALGHLPGGGAFRDVARDVDRARDSMDGFRSSLQRSNDALGRRQNIRLLQQDVSNLRERLSHLDKGTSEYRETAERLRGKQGQLNRVLMAAAAAGDEGAKGPRAIGRSAQSAAGAVDQSLVTIARGFNTIGKQLGGIKPIHYTASDVKVGSGPLAGGVNPELLKAQGGWIGSPGMVGPDSVTIIAAPGEAVLNRHQVPYVDAALEMVGLGSLDDLFATVDRPHYMAAGGYVQGAVPPTNPATRKLADDMFARGFSVTSGLRSSGGTYHQAGSALDFGNSVNNLDRVWSVLFPKRGQFAELFGPRGLYHGLRRFSDAGLQASHEDHVHVALLAALKGALGAAGGFLTAPRIGGPDGLLRSLAQRAAARATSAANDQLASAGGASSGDRGIRAARPDADVVSAFRRAVRTAHATPIERLALFEAGIVESGLRNLSYGGADSLGALQERASIYGRGHALNPFASAMRFLGQAAGLRPWRRSAGQLAAAVQRPAAQFRGRYDLAAGQARRYARGGRVKSQPYTAAGTELKLKSTRALITDRNTQYDKLQAEIEGDRKFYTQADRRYNITDEVLIDPDTGLINQDAINQKAAELANLIVIRERIQSKLEALLRLVNRVIASYNRVIARFEASLRHAKKKDRTGIRAQITADKEKRAEWLEKASDLGFDIGDAKIDVEELVAERATVLGTTSKPVADTTTADIAAEAASAPPTAADIATATIADVASYMTAQQQTLQSYARNFVTPFQAASSGGVFSGSPGQLAALGGARFIGAASTGGLGGDVGRSVVITNNYQQLPDNTQTWASQMRFAAEAAI